MYKFFFFSFLFFGCILSKVKGQDMYDFVKFYEACDEENSEIAIRELKKIDKKKITCVLDSYYYKLFRLYIANGDQKNACKSLSKYASLVNLELNDWVENLKEDKFMNKKYFGFSDSTYYNNLSAFLEGHHYKSFKEKYNANSKKKKSCKSNADWTFMKSIERHSYLDQEIRQIEGDERALFLLDSVNLEGFRNLVKQNGFPHFKPGGYDVANMAYILLLHLVNNGVDDEREFYEFSKELKTLVEKGLFPPKYYAQYIDRFEMIYLKKPTTYGTMNEIGFFPDKNYIDRINLNRKKIGLSRISK